MKEINKVKHLIITIVDNSLGFTMIVRYIIHIQIIDSKYKIHISIIGTNAYDQT